jgi:hypothetical protein
MKHLIKLFNTLINKLKPNKMKGKKIKLKKCTPDGKTSSSNGNFGSCKEYIVDEKNTHYCNAYFIREAGTNVNAGWVYDYEMENFSITAEELQKDLQEAKDKVTQVQNKIDYLNESGAKEYDEEQFKVYSTLKLLENKDLSLIEKSKLIADLIKKS